MVTRIATAANTDAIVRRMLEQQTRVNDGQTQVGSGFKSQDYVGISNDASRLLSIENERERIQRYTSNNAGVATTLNVQLTAVTAIDQQARDMRSELVTFSGHDLTAQTPITQTQIQDIQLKAFNALSQMSYFLNQKVDGKYVFGGGRSDQPPVDFPYNNLEEFQQTYNGTTNVFPSTRVADLVNISYPNIDVNYAQQTIGGKALTEVSSNPLTPGAFVSQTLTNASTGALVFSNSGANGKITSTQPGAFKSIQVGQTILINNAGAGQGGATDNNGVFTITSVSPDGNILTLDQNVNAGTEPAATIGLAIPNGTTLGLTGSSAGNNGAHTVRWPSNADLIAAGYNLSGGSLVDGSQLLIDPPVVSTAGETISLNSTAFLVGTNITTNQKVSDTQSIKMDVTGLDPAFEKLIRGLGILAEGDLINNPTRVTDALALVNDALEHSSLQPTELPSDLQGVQDRLSLNLKTLSDLGDQQKTYLAFLETRQNDIEKADPTEAAVRLNADSSSLQVSYATLAKIQGLSLLDYIK